MNKHQITFVDMKEIASQSDICISMLWVLNCNKITLVGRDTFVHGNMNNIPTLYQKEKRHLSG